jgi:flavorubredoxin
MRQTIEECVAEAGRLSSSSPSATAPPAQCVVELFCARRNTVLDVVNEVLDAPVVMFGTSTFNNAIMPNLMMLLHIIKSYHYKEKAVVCFGSYGWSPLAVMDLEKFAVDGLKWKLILPLISCINELDDKAAEDCKAAAKAAYAAALERAEPGTCLTL